MSMYYWYCFYCCCCCFLSKNKTKFQCYYYTLYTCVCVRAIVFLLFCALVSFFFKFEYWILFSSIGSVPMWMWITSITLCALHFLLTSFCFCTISDQNREWDWRLDKVSITIDDLNEIFEFNESGSNNNNSATTETKHTHTQTIKSLTAERSKTKGTPNLLL